MAWEPAHAVRKLKTTGEHPVWLVHRPGEQPRTLKAWSVTPLRLLTLVLGAAQPQRQIAGAGRLHRAGIRTPVMDGGWRFARRDRAVIELEHVYVEGRSALDMARDDTLAPADVRRVSGAIGDVAAAMVTAGLVNRDFKLANLIVSETGDVWLIDTVAIRADRSSRSVARMLERLAVQLPVMESRLSPAAWFPALRRAMRAIPARRRREVVRWLRAHRQR